jgi:hypothetical protein
MSVLKKSFGRLAELADAYALGAYDFGLESSTLSSPTRDKTGCLLKTVFRKKVEEVNNNTINLRCKLCCIRCNLLQKGYEKKAVDNDFCGFASLRNYRQLSSSCKGAINYSYYTPFFKFMTLAQLQVVSQQTQHIFRNTTVVQRI